eukprot:Awhi_evm1s8080
MTTSNRLKFKLVSSTHGLRSELSLRDNGSNLGMCCDMDREESVRMSVINIEGMKFCYKLSTYQKALG